MTRLLILMTFCKETETVKITVNLNGYNVKMLVTGQTTVVCEVCKAVNFVATKCRISPSWISRFFVDVKLGLRLSFEIDSNMQR